MTTDKPDTPPAGPSGVCEHTCGIDPDEQRRAHALHCAAMAWQRMSATRNRNREMVETAAAFEAYLRGEGGDVIAVTTDSEAYR